MGKRPEDYLDAMEGAQVIVADAMADVPGALIRKMPYLKMIHSEGVAYNRIDLKTAKEREIYVCNCRGMNASAVAEQTVFLMQGMLKNVLLNDRGVREGRQIQIKEEYMVRGDLKELSDCKPVLSVWGISENPRQLFRLRIIQKLIIIKDILYQKKRKNSIKSPIFPWKNFWKPVTL